MDSNFRRQDFDIAGGFGKLDYLSDWEGIVRILSCLGLVATVLACQPPPSANDDRRSAKSVSPAADDEDPSTASRANFEARGLKWPLSVDEGTLGCTNEARWIEVSGVRYGVNGTASTDRGYAAIEPIWRVDEKMAKQLEKLGVPNEPPLRISIGDLIEEAGRLC